MFVTSKKKIVSFAVLVGFSTVTALSARAQAPNVVADAQQLLGSGFSLPQSIAVSSNGTIYVADTGNNQVVTLPNLLPQAAVDSTSASAVSIGNITPALATPQALAFDSSGDLYIGDEPGGVGRVIKLMSDGAGGLSGVAQVVYSGSILTGPIALAVDSAGTLYIGDINGTIFTIAAGGITPAVLNTGLSAAIAPAGFALDAANNLYIVDNNAAAGGVFKVTPGGTATPVSTGQFVIAFPTGVTLDAAGNLFILSQLGSGVTPQVVEIPVASPTTPYILPSSGLRSSSSMAFDPQGNLNLVDFANGNIFQLAYRAPVNMGVGLVGSASSGQNILFNFALNIPRMLQAFKVVTQGDRSKEFSPVSGTCVLGRHNKVGGLPISNYLPYTCSETYTASPAYPGIRSGAIEVLGTGTSILASVPVYETGRAGAEVAYPLLATTTVTGLKQPQALALSGLDKTLYIADTVVSGAGAQGAVYATNGPAGTKLIPVATGREPLVAPSALAVDGAGTLYIADFERADVIKVPPAATGLVATVIDTAGLLQHPISMALDFFGNLYVGDAGSGGLEAGTGNPGFLVEVPISGSKPFKVAIPNVSLVFPQALAIDPITAQLFIGDGGDPAGVGQVIELSTDLSSASIFPVNNVTDPTGLAFDAAEDLYVLDGQLNTVTVVTGGQAGNVETTLPFTNATLSSPSALAVSAGGQSFVIANIGSGSDNSLVYLDGNLSVLDYGNVTVGQSDTMAATVNNIGNVVLTLQSPYYTSGNNRAFTVLQSGCGAGTVLGLYGSCPVNIQFAPHSAGPSAHYLDIQSDGYNTGDTILAAQGIGVK